MTRAALTRPVSSRPGQRRLSRLRGGTTGPTRTTFPSALRSRSGRTVVASSVLAGLVLTGGVAGALCAAGGSAGVGARPALSLAAAAPSPLPLPPVVPSRPTAYRASRGGARTALAPVHYVQRTVPIGPAFSGEVSWYGGIFQGRQTASGEPFDTEQLTAASKTLPFGTRLQVCRTSRCVVVRINDRGPYVGSRVLDLSHAAARALGYDGIAHVTAVPIGTRTVAVPAAPVPAGVRPAAAPAGTVAPAPAARIAAARKPVSGPGHPFATTAPVAPLAGVGSSPDMTKASTATSATGLLPAGLLVGGLAVVGGIVGGRTRGTGRRRSRART